MPIWLALLAYRNISTQGLVPLLRKGLWAVEQKLVNNNCQPVTSADNWSSCLTKNVWQSTTTEELGHLQCLIPVIQSQCSMDLTRPKMKNYSRPQLGPKSAHSPTGSSKIIYGAVFTPPVLFTSKRRVFCSHATGKRQQIYYTSQAYSL